MRMYSKILLSDRQGPPATGRVLSILPATPEDARVIHEIQMRAFAEEGRLSGDLRIPPLAETVADIERHIRDHTVLVARDGERIIGSARGLVDGTVCIIRGVGVEPDCHGRGIGGALLRAIEQAHPDVERFDLTTNTLVPGNVAFYERRGYEITERTAYTDRIVLAQMSKRASALLLRGMTAADVPALFDLRPRTRENAMTREELQRLGITPQSVTESLDASTRGWVCEERGRIVAFSMADRATGEFLVIAVLPAYEGRGVGSRLLALAGDWLAACGCRRAWLTTDLDTTRRAYGFYRRHGWTDWKIERGLRFMEIDLRR
jgi:ribosomal protein S18 acetylase RimI-like enzyme